MTPTPKRTRQKRLGHHQFKEKPAKASQRIATDRSASILNTIDLETSGPYNLSALRSDHCLECGGSGVTVEENCWLDMSNLQSWYTDNAQAVQTTILYLKISATCDQPSSRLPQFEVEQLHVELKFDVVEAKEGPVASRIRHKRQKTWIPFDASPSNARPVGRMPGPGAERPFLRSEIRNEPGEGHATKVKWKYKDVTLQSADVLSDGLVTGVAMSRLDHPMTIKHNVSGIIRTPERRLIDVLHFSYWTPKSFKFGTETGPSCWQIEPIEPSGDRSLKSLKEQLARTIEEEWEAAWPRERGHGDLSISTAKLSGPSGRTYGNTDASGKMTILGDIYGPVSLPH